MEIALSQLGQALRFAFPTALWYLLTVLAILASTLITRWADRRYFEKWMHLYGDRALSSRIQKLENDLRSARDRNKRLLVKYRDAQAQVRESWVVTGEMFGRIQKSVSLGHGSICAVLNNDLQKGEEEDD